MPKRDYYEVLGVNRNSRPEEIKSAYRKLAVQHHPDKNPGDKKAEEHFKEAAEAYSVLSDPDKKANYDRFGHSGVGSPGGFGGFDPDIFADFSDILGDFFGFGDAFGGSRRRRQQRGADLRYDLTISFNEAAFGCRTKLKIPRSESCPPCNGSGADPAHGKSACVACAGQGQVRYQQGFFTISRTCSRCGGAGQIILQPCSECRGAGRIQKEKVLEIKIPAGVDDGSRLRIPGEGEAGVNGGPTGDLYVIISVEEHPFFKRQDSNIYCEVPITFSQAALGAEITVPMLEGSEKITIPEGTQTGSVFRLRGRGIVSLNARGRGDQLVTVTVVTPTKIGKEEKELFQKLAEMEDHEVRGSIFDRVKKEIFG